MCVCGWLAVCVCVREREREREREWVWVCLPVVARVAVHGVSQDTGDTLAKPWKTRTCLKESILTSNR